MMVDFPVIPLRNDEGGEAIVSILVTSGIFKFESGSFALN